MTCELAYKSTLLGSIPATGKLYAPDFDFIPFSLPVTVAPLPELSAFVDVPLSLDLWHACVGHIGKDAVTHLNRVAKGVVLQTTMPLSHCESCILAEHPHQPFHSSETERADTFLDLIHSDVCGPIPTLTTHGKHYFIVFLDDHS
ncbi:hypothetical protein BDR03DRAFT_1027740, partial [Suillus americanus]